MIAVTEDVGRPAGNRVMADPNTTINVTFSREKANRISSCC